jgi:hypothetical protein
MTRIVDLRFMGGLILGLDDGSNLALRVCRVPFMTPTGYVLCAVDLAVALRDFGRTRRLFWMGTLSGCGFVDFTKTCLISAAILTKNE